MAPLRYHNPSLSQIRRVGCWPASTGAGPLQSQFHRGIAHTAREVAYVHSFREGSSFALDRWSPLDASNAAMDFFSGPPMQFLSGVDSAICLKAQIIGGDHAEQSCQLQHRLDGCARSPR